jgi:hypothetical protein
MVRSLEGKMPENIQIRQTYRILEVNMHLISRTKRMAFRHEFEKFHVHL